MQEGNERMEKQDLSTGLVRTRTQSIQHKAGCLESALASAPQGIPIESLADSQFYAVCARNSPANYRGEGTKSTKPIMFAGQPQQLSGYNSCDYFHLY